MRTQGDTPGSPEPDGGLLGRHLRPLLDQRETTVEEMAHAVQDRVADYRTFASAEDEAEWASGLSSLLDLFLALAAEDRWLTPAEAHGIRAIGGRRAEQGFPVGSMRLSVRIAVGVARRRILEEYEPDSAEDRRSLDAVLELLHRFASGVEDLFGEGHEKRRQELQRQGGQTVARLLDAVLDGTLVDDTAYTERARAAGCNPAIPRLVFLAPDLASAIHLRDLMNGTMPGVHVVGRSAPTPHAVVVIAAPLPAGDEPTITRVGEAAAKAGTTVLLVGCFDRVLDAHLGYVGSVVLAPYLGPLADGRSLLRAEDLALYRLAAALPEPVRASLRHEVFRRVDALEPKDAAADYDALACFVQHGFRVSAMERATGRNRKTIYATRDRLAERTGRPLTIHENQAVLTLAYAVHRITG